MSQDQSNLIWIDLEMTGLAVISSTILEIAIVITDADLRELGRWPSGVVGQAIRQPESVLAGMDEWGKRTHTQTGLLGPQGGRHVVHIDLHTGLGPKGVCKLLIDYPLSEDQRTRLAEWFGADSFESCDSSDFAYKPRGGLGHWCISRNLAADYLFTYAEFGTCGAIQMLAGLRTENQAHHWETPSAPSAGRARQHLKELFCPSDEAWRRDALNRAFDLVDRTLRGLAGID